MDAVAAAPLMTTSLVATNLAGAARLGLMQLIHRGSLRPGDRLNEVALAENFGISRGPLREAARALEGEGVLVSRPRLGFYVVSFSPEEIRGVYAAKTWLEQALIDDLQAHCPVERRRGFLAQLLATAHPDRIAFTEALLRFRLELCASLQNRFLAEMMAALYRKFAIIGAVVPVPDSGDRQAWILGVQQRFWTAMIDSDTGAARAILAEDTAHWLADLPARFAEPAPANRARRRPAVAAQ
ncbi:GntR family transcriptional regulator [Roseomonas sp. 18066]|uniref:GntR family transcriptional regulator n=1 Tax=Roseomonas sp. 18066 TaxID=2681412 RepID=UPI00135BD5A6|nr:GntR family transcriptional regulator [Roseomonas sp. 18066]